LPTLVIDTCLAACQVALFDGARMIFGLSEPMERGHQERLAPMAAEVMGEAKVSFPDLGKIAVTTGPGSFTGLRVGLAFAKGLRLATGSPLAGIGTLGALAASAGFEGLSAGAIDARRGMVYLQAFVNGRALSEPEALPAADAASRLAAIAPGLWRVAGPGAVLLAGTDNIEAVDLAAPALRALGGLAAAEPSANVEPLYLRAPDAKPMAIAPVAP
jgi:tRNA threonylcarbamoyladenosine biosynthesis protein TsaB